MNVISKLSALVYASAAVALIALSSGAQAQDRIDQRQANQQGRIANGVKSGQLTPRETINLERGQSRVQRMENRAKADGVVTAKEARRINKARNVQSRKIYNKKHNAKKMG